MRKKDEGQGEIGKFDRLMRGLVAVPKKELVAEIRKDRAKKKRQKKRK